MGQFLSMEVSKYSKGYYPIIDLMITVIWRKDLPMFILNLLLLTIISFDLYY